MSSYLTLYLIACHLTPRQIGWALALSGVVQVAIYPSMGWIANRLGRKNVIQLGDFLGWVVAFVLWTARPGAVMVGIAYVMNQVSGVITPAWNSLFSEDQTPQATSTGYMRLQILTIIGGIAVPILAPWIGHVGIRRSGRVILLLALPVLLGAWLFRQCLLHESSVGESQRAAHWAGARTPLRTRLQLGLSGQGDTLALLRILAQVGFSLFATFAPLTFVLRRGLDISVGTLAFLPLATSIFGLVLWHQHTRIAKLPPRTTLGLAILTLMVGFSLLAVTPRAELWTLLVAWGLIVSGQGLYWSSHTTYWMTWIPDAARVDIQAVVGGASALLVTILAPTLSPGIVQSPHLLYWSMLALGLVLAGIWSRLPHAANESSHPG